MKLPTPCTAAAADVARKQVAATLAAMLMTGAPAFIASPAAFAATDGKAIATCLVQKARVAAPHGPMLARCREPRALGSLPPTGTP